MARRYGRGRRRSGRLWRWSLTALLGLSRRPAPPAGRERRRGASTSSFEAPAEAANPLQFGRAYQLPPFGRGNGLDALFWTPLAELPADRVDPVLAALRERDIAAWVAPGRRGTRSEGDEPHDLWVASGELNDAQDVVMRVLGAPDRDPSGR